MSIRPKRERRRVERSVVLLLVFALLAALLAGLAAACGEEEESTGPDTSAIQTGGTLRVGTQPGDGGYDPALFSGTYGDILLQRQILEKLVDVDAGFNLVPVLATEWESEDGKVWTFTLRDGATFTNGEPFSADDVVYTMDRLRSRELGSPMADVYANIASVVADDATHVTFNLESPDSEFPATLTDYRTLMLSKSVTDPAKEIVGTGPFVLEDYVAEDRAVLKANPDYWGTDEAGNKLPYLDGIEFIYSPDVAGQVEGLLGGSLDWVGGLTAEQRLSIEASSGFTVLTANTNNAYTLQVRCDRGPGKELAFRQALMAGTDRQALVDLVAPDNAEPGNGTLVGPAYAAYYLDESPAFDQAKAKELLAQAGYSDGAKIKLVVQSMDPMPALATAWQAQMKQIGVEVEIQQMPPDVFYAEKGADNYYTTDFCIVDWGTRVPPITYFQLALLTGAPWNNSRWSDSGFDSVVDQIPLELDETKRGDLYKQAEKIIQDQVPILNFITTKGIAAQTSTLSGVDLAPDWGQTVFNTAHFAQ